MPRSVLSAFAVLAVALGVGACSPQTTSGASSTAASSGSSTPAQAAAPPPATPTYEIALINGSPQADAGYFRINVQTGQVMQWFGGNTPAQYTVIADSTLPAGQYHLKVWQQPQDAQNNVYWGMERYDAVSGRTWVLIGGDNNTPFSWEEITAPN